MTEVIQEDWSDARSPSRAIRRHRQGHKQRMIYTDAPTVDEPPKLIVSTERNIIL